MLMKVIPRSWSRYIEIANLQGRRNLSSKYLPSSLTFSRTYSSQPDDAESKKPVNIRLAECLERELKEELKENNRPASPLIAFIKESGFELKQTDGSAVVELHKWLGKEKIIVRFSILDTMINKLDKKFIKINLFSKSNQGSLFFDCEIFDGYIGFSSVHLYTTERKLQPLLPEYTPFLDKKVFHQPFELLTEEVKEAFENYFEARGLSDEMSAFIRNFSLFKEQNEYMNWLDNMGKFMRS